jgi:hypothetical protein
MFEICVAGMPGTVRERAFAIPDLHQVLEQVAGLVAV